MDPHFQVYIREYKTEVRQISNQITGGVVNNVKGYVRNHLM